MASLLLYIPAALSGVAFVGVLFLRPRPHQARKRR
jgi:hypothetical protein